MLKVNEFRKKKEKKGKKTRDGFKASLRSKHYAGRAAWQNPSILFITEYCQYHRDLKGEKKKGRAKKFRELLHNCSTDNGDKTR